MKPVASISFSAPWRLGVRFRTDFRQLDISAASYLGLDPALAFEQSFTPIPCVPG